MERKIKAVLFDMDGVLIDAKDWHYEALNKALKLFGMEITRYDHLVTYDGLPTRKKLEMLTLERGLPRSLHGFINELKQRYTLEIVYGSCFPIFHHQYALARLRSEGYRLAVCSNSIRQTIDVMLERAELMQYFEFCLSNQDVVNGKPNPEIYLKAIERLDIDADECLIVEDNHHGIQAAKASGAYVLEVAGPFQVTYPTIQERLAEIEHSNSVLVGRS
jgi:beta-phosphoglucomutase